MISDDDAEKAVDFIRDNARNIAQAKAHAIYMDDYTKVVKAAAMRNYVMEPLGAQEREAYASVRYSEHLAAKREADEKYEYLRWMMTAAEAKFEAWRSQSANNRKGFQ